MSDQIIVATATRIDADTKSRQVVQNIGPGTVSYGPTAVSLSSSLTVGASVTISTATYFQGGRISISPHWQVDARTIPEIDARIDSLEGGVFVPYGATGDGVTDDTAALQAALDAANTAGGGRVIVAGGTYLTSSALTIGSNTLLYLSPQATIKRNSSQDNMIRNKSDGVTGAYGQASNITVQGGTWDVNKAAQASTCTAIAFGHAEYVTVRDLTVKNNYVWHCIELNSTRHGEVRNCRFRDYDAAASAQEMVQLDMAANVGVFPWFGPYDNTVCDSILITGCVFNNGSRGIGSHTAGTGPHTNIRVIGNHFTTLREEGIRAYEWQRVSIIGNTFYDCQTAVYWTADTYTEDGCTISNNVIDGNARATSRGIRVFGTTVASRFCRNVTIVGNTVRNTASHGINVDCVQGFVISDNHVATNAGNPIWPTGSTKGSVVGNRALGAGGTADIIIGNTSGALADTTDITVVGNTCGRLYVADFNTRIVLRGNIADTWYATTGSPVGVQASDNYQAGLWQGSPGSVASAATVTLPPGAKLVTITGTTNITSVTAGQAGEQTTLVFAGILTFTDGSNLKLAGNFVTTADDSITLVCDGTNWIEVARSVN